MDLLVETSGNKHGAEHLLRLHTGVDGSIDLGASIINPRSGFPWTEEAVANEPRSYISSADKRGPDSGTHLSLPHRLVLFN